MKKYLAFLIVLGSCSQSRTESDRQPFKYKVGDVVILQPDSVRAIITDTAAGIDDSYYRVGVTTREGLQFQNVSDIIIIKKVEK